MNIGICQKTGRIYSGNTSHGIVLSPTPTVSPCKFVTDKTNLHTGPDKNNLQESYMFLEEFYDPKSRVRRGRIFKAWGSQPQTWRSDNQAVYGNFDTYGHYSIWSNYHNKGQKHIYVLLGDQKRFSIWKIIDLEVIATGEEMITLKALSSLGLIPELIEKVIPPDELPLIQDKLNILLDDMYTASCESVVDCCREAATAIIGAFVKRPEKDLGKLVNCLSTPEHPFRIAHKAAGIINDLHPRRKTAETRSRDLRRITDEDAQLAIHCVTTILVEFGWGRW
jgi:hypothetical protein